MLPTLFDLVPGSVWSFGIRELLLGIGIWLLGLIWPLVPNWDVNDDEPPYLPYYIPWIGHTVGFIQDSNQVFRRALERFGFQPFTLKIAGRKYYVITHPQHVASVFKVSKSLTFDSSTTEILGKIYGMSDESEISLKELLGTGRDGNLGEDYHIWVRRELSGQALQVLVDKAMVGIQARLDKEVDRIGPVEEEVDFLMWTRNTLSDAVTNASFGPNFLKSFPNAIQNLWTMDDGTWKLLYGMPKVFTKEECAAREGLVATLETYLDDTEEGATLREGALPFIVGREEVTKAAGQSLDGRARSLLAILHAIHTNSAPTTFWILLYIINTPGLYTRIMGEIIPAFIFSKGSPAPLSFDLSYLTSPKTCPLFNSVYTETLRLVSSTISVRVVDETTPNIGGYTLHAGAKVFCPARPLQTSTEFWGSDARQFVPDRFVHRPTNSEGSKMRPFGGGPTLCPGRHFASAEIKAFVAGALMRFDFHFDQGMPRLDERTPSLGVMRPVGVPMARISRRRASSVPLV